MGKTTLIVGLIGTGKTEYGMRLNACVKWCDHHNVQIDFKE